MSLVENLKTFHEKGVDGFLILETEKWRCPRCGGTICCHNGLCFACQLEVIAKRKLRYRWDEK